MTLFVVLQAQKYKIERSKLITGINISEGINRDTFDYYIKLGKSRYYNFGEAQALLNDLENHAE